MQALGKQLSHLPAPRELQCLKHFNTLLIPLKKYRQTSRQQGTNPPPLSSETAHPLRCPPPFHGRAERGAGATAFPLLGVSFGRIFPPGMGVGGHHHPANGCSSVCVPPAAWECDGKAGLPSSSVPVVLLGNGRDKRAPWEKPEQLGTVLSLPLTRAHPAYQLSTRKRCPALSPTPQGAPVTEWERLRREFTPSPGAVSSPTHQHPGCCRENRELQPRYLHREQHQHIDFGSEP